MKNENYSIELKHRLCTDDSAKFTTHYKEFIEKWTQNPKPQDNGMPDLLIYHTDEGVKEGFRELETNWYLLGMD